MIRCENMHNWSDEDHDRNGHYCDEECEPNSRCKNLARFEVEVWKHVPGTSYPHEEYVGDEFIKLCDAHIGSHISHGLTHQVKMFHQVKEERVLVDASLT